jgi:endonuclease/exonuclease/phosphatase family metal-dependent hydrolase
MRLRVLTWNLKHGRSVPSAGRDLLPEFAGALARWEWDVALLQEVPPWWPAVLAPDAQARLVLTSRNSLLAARRAIATRWPDAAKSNGGGANAILVRGAAIDDHRTLRLARWPERRRLHAVSAAGAWFGNLHASGKHLAESGREFELARTAMLRWAGGAPAVLGGDFNVHALYLPGFTYAGGEGVDHLFATGLRAAEPAETLERGRLSDHAPVRTTLETPIFDDPGGCV